MNPFETVMNRATQPEGGWYHIVPEGEFPGFITGKDGKELAITQVCDAEAMNRMQAACAMAKSDPEWPGYLVSREHFAHMPDQSSEALAWAPEIKIVTDGEPRRRGLWARYEKTPLGEQLIGTAYKFATVVANVEKIGNGRYRLIELVDIGCTNKPQLKTLVPAMNREPDTQESPMLDKVLQKLGLGSDAQEDAVMSALEQVLNRAGEVDALQARVAEIEGQLAEANTKILNREAEEFVAKHAAKIADKDAMKALFVKNREAAEALIGAVKEPEQKRVLNREDTTPPETSVTEENAVKVANRKREQDAHVDEVQARLRIRNRSDAVSIAIREKPDLWK